jgi:ferredoxin-fold anticodon binding domain-containing protein
MNDPAKDYDLAKKYIRKAVSWRPPYSSLINIGLVKKVKDGYLIVEKNHFSEGIKEDWIVHVHTI